MSFKEYSQRSLAWARERLSAGANWLSAYWNGAGAFVRDMISGVANIWRQLERDDRRAPSYWLLARECGYALSILRGRLALRGLARSYRHRANRRPVLLVPGFLADNRSLFVLYAALRLAGFRARHWGLGRNRGQSDDIFDRLIERLERMNAHFEQPVTVIGWSLGGLFAREIAKRRPDLVRDVVTLGSPFSGSLRANNMWWLYERLVGQAVDDAALAVELSAKPPVPTVAFWSRWDGVIAPASARGEEGERDQAVELGCSHMGYVSDPLAIEAVLRHLCEGSALALRGRRATFRMPAKA